MLEMNNAKQSPGGYKIPDEPKPPMPRMVPVSDPEEILAIQRAGLRDPIGVEYQGTWFAEAFSLKQYRKEPVEIEV